MMVDIKKHEDKALTMKTQEVKRGPNRLRLFAVSITLLLILSVAISFSSCTGSPTAPPLQPGSAPQSSMEMPADMAVGAGKDEGSSRAHENMDAQNGTQSTAGEPVGRNASAGEPSGGNSNGNAGGENAGASKPNGGNSGTAELPAQSHKHTWVDVTEKRWVSNSVWVVDQAAWDEQVATGSIWHCNCGATFYSASAIAAHAEEMALQGSFNHGSWVETIYGTVHHDEVGHWEDRGHYETVVVGRKCSGCGAVR